MTFGFENNFLNMTPKLQATKEKLTWIDIAPKMIYKYPKSQWKYAQQY